MSNERMDYTSSIIPKILLCQRFIKTINKVPIEEEWPIKNNYNLSDSSFIAHINQYNNYGVLCGFNNLLVIDCDCKEIQDSLLQYDVFKNTFIVKTATKGLYHFYFYCDEMPVSFKVLDTNGNTMADGQGKGRQVIGPNSQINGKSYEVVNDVNIQIVKYIDIKNMVTNALPNSKTTSERVSQKKDDYVETDQVLKYIKDNIKISAVLKDAGIDVTKNPTDCPFHSSVNHACLSFDDNKNVFHCFHCFKEGNIFHLYMDLHNVNFTTAKEKLLSIIGVKKYNVEDVSVRVLHALNNDNRALATELLVEAFESINYIKTIRNDVQSYEVWIYDNGIYVPHGRSYITQYCREILSDKYTTAIANLVVDKIAQDTFIEDKDFFINENINKICIQNGILNIFTREIEDFSPKYTFFNKLPISFFPTSDCPVIKKHMGDILQDKNDVLVMQELFGYLLYRDYKFEKGFMFTGTGRNGKGKTIELMKRFLGADNTCNISLQSLEKDNFIMSVLHNKFANLSADISDSALQETGNFKSLTGHDLITAPRKFLQPIHFVNFAKMIFSANKLPESSDFSIGFLDRWIIFDFKYRFYLKTDYDKVENKTDFDKCADENIVEKISTQDELNGLLNWALDGLDRLFKQKGFSKSTSTEDTKMQWLCKSSTFMAFAYSNIEYHTGSNISKQVLRDMYSLFCRDNNLKVEDNKKIYNGMKNEFKSNSFQDKSTYEYYWINVRFKDSVVIPKNVSDNTLTECDHKPHIINEGPQTKLNTEIML